MAQTCVTFKIKPPSGQEFTDNFGPSLIKALSQVIKTSGHSMFDRVDMTTATTKPIDPNKLIEVSFVYGHSSNMGHPEVGSNMKFLISLLERSTRCDITLTQLTNGENA